jgi:hypothetical protein
MRRRSMSAIIGVVVSLKYMVFILSLYGENEHLLINK